MFFIYPSLAQQELAVELHSLQGVPPLTTGISWGVPFAQGVVKKEQDFILQRKTGESFPLQQWSMAYWPDGSIKWLGMSTVMDSSSSGTWMLKALKPSKKKKKLPEKQLAVESSTSIRVNTGTIQCVINKKGAFILDSVYMKKTLVAVQGNLRGIWQNHPDGDYLGDIQHRSFTGSIESVMLEQNGPVRCVVHIKGKHAIATSEKVWLPFDLRLYFYSGVSQVNVVHTIVYDGDDRTDFIKALGISFDVLFREEVHNRHVRFGGEEHGIWDEPVKPLISRRRVDIDGKPVYDDQVRGIRIPEAEKFSSDDQEIIGHLAGWNDYRILQANADGFTIQKRTNDQSSWLDVIGGKRASGLAFVGDVSGGMAVGVKDFWQSHPSGLEINNTLTGKASLTGWFWPPQSEAMDLRHYDTLAYGHNLNASYEDVQPGFSTAHGVARTSELTLFFWDHVPSNKELSSTVDIFRNKQLLVASPEYLHSVRSFGMWSVPDYSSPGKKWIEQQLTNALDFYKTEIEQRHWYGFWDYGDVMHSYDPVRHTWRYDVGGFAWANTELVPDIWLWYSFLRTGRQDVFTMAEAMTRHTSEVDVYHLGRFEALGSRHNVSHWGCGAKEVRISQAALKRFYYYLTTDERTGDLITEVAEKADLSMTSIDPLRLILKDSLYPSHIRIGPDWLALVGNWMTMWERTGDRKWKEKIEAGVNSFISMRYGFFSGVDGAFGYTPTDKKIHVLGDDTIGVTHLTTLMGGAEVAFELSTYWDNKDWQKLWLDYCRLYGAPKEDVEKAFGKKIVLGNGTRDFARLPAYAAYRLKDPVLARRAWDQVLNSRFRDRGDLFDTVEVDTFNTIYPIKEVPDVSTNSTAQWCLNAIELLELAGDNIPAEHTYWSEKKK